MHCPSSSLRAVLQGFVTNPADVLKTRVQSGAASTVGVALRDCLKAGGKRSLMRGAGMRVAWIAPQGCIYYPAYETVQRMLSKESREKKSAA